MVLILKSTDDFSRQTIQRQEKKQGEPWLCFIFIIIIIIITAYVYGA